MNQKIITFYQKIGIVGETSIANSVELSYYVNDGWKIKLISTTQVNWSGTTSLAITVLLEK